MPNLPLALSVSQTSAFTNKDTSDEVDSRPPQLPLPAALSSQADSSTRLLDPRGHRHEQAPNPAEAEATPTLASASPPDDEHELPTGSRRLEWLLLAADIAAFPIVPEVSPSRI